MNGYGPTLRYTDAEYLENVDETITVYIICTYVSYPRRRDEFPRWRNKNKFKYRVTVNKIYNIVISNNI